MDAQPKPWWKSKTVMINLVVLICTFLVDIPAELRALGVPEQTALRVATIGNMGLRFLAVARITATASQS